MSDSIQSGTTSVQEILQQQVDAPNNSAPWYIPSMGPRLKSDTRAFYAAYVGIQGAELEQHLLKIVSYNILVTRHDTNSSQRDQAWPLSRYPCVGNWGFLYCPLIASPGYEGALSRARKGGIVLDFGCGFGQDLRRMALDGVSTEGMWATDLNGKLWELGFELFRDRERMRAHFVEGDVFAPETGLVETLKGKVDVVLAYQFIHLFSWDNQVKLCEMITEMSKPGSIVLGSQMGSREFRQQKTPWGEMCLQNSQSWKELWKVVAEKTGVPWEVSFSREVDLGEWGLQYEDYKWMNPRNCAFDFVVERKDES